MVCLLKRLTDPHCDISINLLFLLFCRVLQIIVPLPAVDHFEVALIPFIYEFIVLISFFYHCSPEPSCLKAD